MLEAEVMPMTILWGWGQTFGLEDSLSSRT